MKALVIPQPGSLELRDVPVPMPGPHEALVRIHACGICSTTDREIIAGRQPYHSAYPALLGHEAVGEVVELGSMVRNFALGNLVTRPCAIWPGTAQHGLASGWGGFAEYGIVRDRLAMAADGDPSMLEDYTALRQNVLPENLGVNDAVVAIALAETMSWLHQMPAVGGVAVCVSGTGIAGLGIGLWCKRAGASKVIVLGRRDERLAVARRICADAVINVTTQDVVAEVNQLTQGAGVDFYAEAVGQEDQVNVGLSVLTAGGTVGVYGAAEGQRYQLGWGSSRGHASVRLAPAREHLCYGTVADLISRGVVVTGDFLTHSWPVAEFEQAFREIQSGQVLKGLLTFGS